MPQSHLQLSETKSCGDQQGLKGRRTVDSLLPALSLLYHTYNSSLNLFTRPKYGAACFINCSRKLPAVRSLVQRRGSSLWLDCTQVLHDRHAMRPSIQLAEEADRVPRYCETISPVYKPQPTRHPGTRHTRREAGGLSERVQQHLRQSRHKCICMTVFRLRFSAV